MKTTATLEETRESLYTGADDILVGLGVIPPTKHDLSDGSKFAVDAWQMDVGTGINLFITIHGEFIERASSHSRRRSLAYFISQALVKWMEYGPLIGRLYWHQQ